MLFKMFFGNILSSGHQPTPQILFYPHKKQQFPENEYWKYNIVQKTIIKLIPDLMIMQPLNERITEIQIFSEKEKLKTEIECQDEADEAVQEINTLKVQTVRMFLEQQVGSATGPRLQVLETINYNGNLVRINYAATRGSAIYSQPFYTSKYGYKMCLAIYLNNGDEIVKNTYSHITLYFILMKGKYDAFLPFPFKSKVTLSLRDSTFVLIPDSSSSFKKPISDMNIAWDFPWIVSYDKLKHRNDVVNEVIEVKAVIDTSELYS